MFVWRSTEGCKSRHQNVALPLRLCAGTDSYARVEQIMLRVAYLSCVSAVDSTSSRLATLMARNAAETGVQGAAKHGLGWPQSLVGRVVRGVEGRTGALTIPAPPPASA